MLAEIGLTSVRNVSLLAVITRRLALRLSFMLWISLPYVVSPYGDSVEQTPDEAFGYVTLRITLYDGPTRKRVNAVSAVFSYCRSRDRPSAILAAADSTVSATLRARFGRSFEVTQRYISGFDRVADAAAQRKAALRDRYFDSHLSFDFVWRRQKQCAAVRKPFENLSDAVFGPALPNVFFAVAVE